MRRPGGDRGDVAGGLAVVRDAVSGQFGAATWASSPAALTASQEGGGPAGVGRDRNQRGLASLVNYAGPATTRGSGGPPRVKHLRPINRGSARPSIPRDAAVVITVCLPDLRHPSVAATVCSMGRSPTTRGWCPRTSPSSESAPPVRTGLAIGGPGARPSSTPIRYPYGDTSSPSRNGAQAGTTGIRPTVMSSLSARSTASVVALCSRAASRHRPGRRCPDGCRVAQRDCVQSERTIADHRIDDPLGNDGGALLEGERPSWPKSPPAAIMERTTCG